MDQFIVVLFQPKYEGNLGAVCRAMKNMGATHLRLVKPSADKNRPEAHRMAMGGRDILENATHYETLKEAVADASFVIGTSGKIRETPLSILTPREISKNIQEISGKVALVFGPEDQGLTHLELKLCHQMITIPSNSNFNSLNLAQSVVIILYELSLHYQSEFELKNKSDLNLTSKDFEQFFDHMQNSLTAIEYLNPENPEHIMKEFRHFFLDSHLTQRQMSLFRGLWNKIITKIDYLKSK